MKIILQFILVLFVSGYLGAQDIVMSSEQFESTFEESLSSNKAVSDSGLAELNIFPNPANQYFQITNNSEVASIHIYDIVGKKVMIAYHTNGKQYNISDLRKGLYIVRLIDQSGAQVKSLRLSKR